MIADFVLIYKLTVTMSEPQKRTKEEEHKNVPVSSPEDMVVNVDEDKWLIRDCSLYKDEYKECTSFHGRFQQLFVFGETLDCNQWKKDYNNCCKWQDENDTRAAEALIKSERTRRLERLRAHYRNDTWKKRDAPPGNWDQPLPEWLAKRDENSYLSQKAKELREGVVEEDKSFCSIM